MSTPTYEERVKQQVEQYTHCQNIHDLPEVFHIWSQRHVYPGLSDVFSAYSIPEFYAMAYLEAKPKRGIIGTLLRNTNNILSIGCGDGHLELDIVKYLIERGQRDFTITCADLSPILLGRLKTAAEKEDLANYIEILQADLNIELPDKRYDMIMANHSLHHIVELEHVFDYIYTHLTDRGIFVTNDMVGRNGHMRWAETAAVINAFWPMLNDREKWNAQLQRLDDTFVDHDCSTEGFEGIRSQDILPLLLERFHPYKFFACGGFVDLIVDRSYGRAYDVDKTEDVEWIKFLGQLNDIMLDAGCIKPTMIHAYFSKTEAGRAERFYRNRKASTCVRREEPSWVKYYT